MKNKLKKSIICLLTVIMVSVTTLPIQAISSKTSKKSSEVTYEYKWTSKTTDLKYNDKNKYIMEVTITIPENASDTVKINFNDIHDKYLLLRKENGMTSSKSSMPGDSYPIEIKIINNSGQKYSYKNNSLVIEPMSSDYGLISKNDATVALLDQNNDDNISINELVELYTVLEKKGYKNDGMAFERYLVNFTNEVYDINVKNMGELVNKYPYYAANVLGGNSNDLSKPVTDILEYRLSSGEFEEFCDKYDWFEEYAKKSSKPVTEKGIEKFKYSVIYPEHNLGKLSSVLFYQNYLSIGYGKGINKVDLETSVAAKLITANSEMLNYRVNDYVIKNNSYFEMNDFLTQTTQPDAWVDNVCTFNYTIALSSKIGNAYVGYVLSYNNTIELEKVITHGDVTVDKTLDLSGYKYNDSPSFIFKLTDVNGKEYFKVMSFKEGQTYQSIVFENIPLGSYTVEELDSIRYEVIGESTDNGVLTSTNNSQIVFFKNKKEKNNDFSDTNVVVNSFQKTDNGIEISQDYMETQR